MDRINQEFEQNIEDRITYIIRKEEEKKERMKSLVLFNLDEPTSNTNP